MQELVNRKRRRQERDEAIEELIRAVGECKADVEMLDGRMEEYERRQSILIRAVWMVNPQMSPVDPEDAHESRNMLWRNGLLRK
jgi:hypothetical protein